MAQLSLEVIDDFSRLIAVRSEWSVLARSIEGLTPFQLPEWLVTWWRHFGSGRLRCLLFREGDEVAGIVPCFLHPWNGAQQITLLGAGISDYLEPAMKPEYADEIVTQIGRYLRSTSDWDICDWQELSFDTPLKSLASEIVAEAPCMAVPLEGSFEEYWENCSRSLRKNVHRDRVKAQSRGEIRFEVTKEAQSELLDGLIEMHRERWERKDQSGMIEANGSAEFLREAAREFADHDMLRLFSLRFDGKLVAMILAFAYRGRMSNYLTGFDPEYERLGFGRTLLYEAVRHCHENGYKAWDFLRGDEPYKQWWRAHKIPKVRVRVLRRA